jgi:hypothetical protein
VNDDPHADETIESTDADADEVDAADDILLEELRAVVNRFDPVSPEMVATARATFMWRTIDAELAQLTHDSVLDEQPVLTRGVAAAPPTLLTFEAPGLTVEVETISADAGWQLHGQLVPPQAGEIEVRHPAGSTTVPADEMGRFAAHGPHRGPVSLRCRAGDTTVDTDWFLA